MKKHDKKIKGPMGQNISFTVDSPTWREPRHMDIGSLRDILDIPNKVDSSVNIFAYKFKNQDIEPTLPPGSHKLDKSLELAVDDNFLYVWVKHRWKRIPLSEF
jgi:hypothetical protein